MFCFFKRLMTPILIAKMIANIPCVEKWRSQNSISTYVAYAMPLAKIA